MARKRVAKRKSAPASPADEPASTKQRSPTEPARMVTCAGDWTTSMRRLRDVLCFVVYVAKVEVHASTRERPQGEGL